MTIQSSAPISTADISVNLGGIRLANPVVMASGTFGYGQEYKGLVDVSHLGAVIVKGTTRYPRKGNPPPRIVETPSGMLNSIGLENPGIHAFIDTHLPRLIADGATVIANIAGHSVDEYAEMAAMLDECSGIAGIELNISCPNVEKGGMHFGSDPLMVYEVVSAVRKATTLPVIPKLSPNVGDIVAIARAAEHGGANGLSMINTVLGMAVDIDKRRPVLGNILGGLSGPAIKPIALRMIYQVYKDVRLPILGGGGIVCVRDALEFFMVGCTAVSIGAGTFANPNLAMEVVSGITSYLSSHGHSSISQIIGVAVV